MKFKEIPDNEVVMYHSPAVVFLASGNKSVMVPATDDPELFWEYVRENRVRYIIVDEMHREIHGGIYLFTPDYLAPALKARPGKWRVIFRAGNSNSVILRVSN